jgi:hypothetical protein
MMRFAIPFLVAFVVATGGASGVVVMRAKAAQQAAAAAHADSLTKHLISDSTSKKTGAEAVKADSTAEPKTEGASATVEATVTGGEKTVPPVNATGLAATPEKSPAAEKTAAPAPIVTPVAGKPSLAALPKETAVDLTKPKLPIVTAPAAGAAPAPATSLLLPGSRITKIFTAMPPKDAAKVLEQMDESDVVTILNAVGEKRAAQILALLPTARAAAISKTVLAGKRAAK